MAVFVDRCAWVTAGSSRVAFPLLFAVALATFGAGHANASCGDYVMVGGMHSDHQAQPEQPLDEQPPPGRSPCHGPHCQKQSPLPAAPERGTSESLTPQWADWRAMAVIFSLDGRLWRLETAACLPDVYVSAVWRPPAQI